MSKHTRTFHVLVRRIRKKSHQESTYVATPEAPTVQEEEGIFVSAKMMILMNDSLGYAPILSSKVGALVLLARVKLLQIFLLVQLLQLLI